MVCLTGQVPTHLIGNDAFQEADTTGITRPATKHNYLVKRAEDLARMVHEAFYVARSGRPGPVVVDLPKDIVIGKAPYAPALGRPSQLSPADPARPRPDRPGDRSAEVGKAAGGLRRRRRDQCRAGGVGGLRRFVRMTGFPITNTLMGLGAYPASRSAVPRHARYARHLRGQSRHAWLRRAAGDRRAVR